MASPLRVLIAGGGVAGLEAMLALRDLGGDRVQIELLSPSEEFVLRPMLVAEPFGVADALRLPLAELTEAAGTRHRRGSLASVDAGAQEAVTESGERLEYDALLVALGARPVRAVPGALSFGAPTERQSLADVLARLGRKGMKRLAFVVPRAATWPIAAYELALLTAAERDVRNLRGVELFLVTHEPEPLSLFGPSASSLVATRLAEARITLVPSTTAESFAGHELRMAGDGAMEVDSVIALPALEGPGVPGLPARGRGFIPVDTMMQVHGLQNVWAAGDATSFPVKQGGLAAQMADAAARAIAVRAGARVPTEHFQAILRAELLTGGAPVFMRRSQAGDDSATAGTPLWFPPAKVAGRYLGVHLSELAGLGDDAELADVPPANLEAAEPASVDQTVAVLLAAADADAAAHEYERALRWLSLVEQLDLVIPAGYVAKRDEWRRELTPDTGPSEAAQRIDPSLASAAAALSDLERRVGWLRELERDTGHEMGDRIAELGAHIERVRELSRAAGIIR